MEKTKKIKVLTHDGVFHADDTMSLTILSSIYDEIESVRSRKASEENYFHNADFVIDVSGKFDGERFFDHHQTDSPTRENGMPYSSAGMIWSKFGRQVIEREYFLSNADVDKVWKIVDETIIIPIDLMDNGKVPKSEVPILSFSAIISQMNPEWNSKDSFDCRFEQAVGLCRVILLNAIRSAVATVEAESIVDKFLKQSPKGLLVMDRGMPWQKALLENPDSAETMFAVYPNPNMQ
jgi:uncharacterized UPF0160 family protein